MHGNVVSNGGGTAERFFNFPIKDNVIDGNVVIHGWTGGWWGLIANTVGGNVDLSNNRSVVQPAGDCEGTFPVGCDAAPGADTDAAEIQSRGPDNPQRISGNLICHGNTPSAQINPLDGGFPKPRRRQQDRRVRRALTAHHRRTTGRPASAGLSFSGQTVAGVAGQAPEDLVHEVGVGGERLDSLRAVGVAGSFERSVDPSLPLCAGQPREQHQPEPLEIVGPVALVVPHLKRMLVSGLTLNPSSRHLWPFSQSRPSADGGVLTPLSAS